MATLTPTSEDTRIYEICVLIPHPLSQKEEQEIIKRVESLLEETGGTQIAKDMWGQRGLAYKIRGHEEGNFLVYHYEFDPAKLKELDESLRIAQGVLRHLIIKPPKGYEVVKYSEAYADWLQTRETEVEVRKQEKEDALKKKIVEKQKRQAARAAKTTAKEETGESHAEKSEAKPEELSAEIDKLIADDELEL